MDGAPCYSSAPATLSSGRQKKTWLWGDWASVPWSASAFSTHLVETTWSANGHYDVRRTLHTISTHTLSALTVNHKALYMTASCTFTYPRTTPIPQQNIQRSSRYKHAIVFEQRKHKGLEKLHCLWHSSSVLQNNNEGSTWSVNPQTVNFWYYM